MTLLRGEYTQEIDMNAVMLDLVWKFEINVEEGGEFQPAIIQLTDIYLDSATIDGCDKEVRLDAEVEKVYELRVARELYRNYSKYVYSWEG
jgi:hypothetical protein